MIAQTGEEPAIDVLTDLLGNVMGRRVGLPQVHTASGAAPDLEQAAAAAAAARTEDRALVKRTRERYAAVQALRAQGKGIKPIMRELHLAKETVRKFARAGSAEELLARPRAGRPGILDEHKPYLHERWNAGCTNVLQLHAEITARGYRGSYGTVNLYLQPFRALGAAPATAPAPPKVRDITGWMLRHPDSLDADEQAKLAEALARCPDLDATAAHVSAFAEMMTGRHGERLDAWITAVDAGDRRVAPAAGRRRSRHRVRTRAGHHCRRRRQVRPRRARRRPDLMGRGQLARHGPAIARSHSRSRHRARKQRGHHR